MRKLTTNKNEKQNKLTKISIFKRRIKNLKNRKQKNKQKDTKLLEKARSKNKLRVIYKAPGKDPEVRIIPNVFILKKAVINRQLDIIPYQNVFIVFNKQKEMQKEPINIILDMCNIKGELIIVQIDKKKREFESLSQENIIWFTEDLINKSPIKNNVININDWKALKAQDQNTQQLTKKQIKDYYSKELILFDTEEKAANNVSFEQSLINVLTNIELTLASLLEIKKN